jgi:hypothetical protein
MNKFMLTLSGFGYLEKVTRKDNQIIVSIKAIIDVEACPSQDEVILDCVLDDTHKLAAYFKTLAPLLVTGNIILHYKAHYEAFNVAHAGRDTSDPKHLISLQAKLLSVQRCFVNGELFKPANQAVFNAGQYQEHHHCHL